MNAHFHPHMTWYLCNSCDSVVRTVRKSIWHETSFCILTPQSLRSAAGLRLIYTTWAHNAELELDLVNYFPRLPRKTGSVFRVYTVAATIFLPTLSQVRRFHCIMHSPCWWLMEFLLAEHVVLWRRRWGCQARHLAINSNARVQTSW